MTSHLDPVEEVPALVAKFAGTGKLPNADENQGVEASGRSTQVSGSGEGASLQSPMRGERTLVEMSAAVSETANGSLRKWRFIGSPDPGLIRIDRQ